MRKHQDWVPEMVKSVFGLDDELSEGMCFRFDIDHTETYPPVAVTPFCDFSR